ncbi:MAG: ABC transporter substrate-binding protein [Epsilonproteobacteria bacterium]|nr:ABC transporter substrate-binding protein [Campylobacterota bacterium]
MHKIVFFVFLITQTLFALVADKKLDPVSVQLHWKYQFEFAGFIAAKEKGFYKDVGLDVTLKEYEKGMDVIEEVLRKNATFGIYNSQILLEYLRGKPIVLLASFFKRSALVLIAQPEIKSLKDLEHKTIMASTKKDFLLNFQPYFKKYHVNIDTIKFFPHTYTLDPFIEKKVAAMTAFISDQPYKLQKQGVKYRIFDPSDDNLFVMQMELFTSKDELQKHPQRTRDFIRATIKGWEYAFAHKEEIAKIIHEKYNSTFSIEQLLAEAEAIERLILPYTYEIGSIDKGFLKKQAKEFQRNYKNLTEKNLIDYIYDLDKTGEIEFTFKELKYIKKHPVVSICPHYNLFPIDGIENGKQTGIMGDIFQIISKKTGLSFRLVKSKDFKEMQENVVQKRCQVLAIATPEVAKKYGLYATKIITEDYFTIITSINKSFVKNIEAIEDKLLLIKDPVLFEYVHQLYPSLNLKMMTDENKMVDMVVNEEAYGIITFNEQSDYFIDEYGFGKLKLGGFLAKEKPIKAVIAIRKEDPILASIIQKVLYSIPDKQIDEIIQGWHMTRYHTKIDYQLLFSVFMIMFFIVFMMLYYQRKIKKINAQLEQKVYEKTKELRELNERLEALVKEKVKEIVQKDRLLAVQSKQAIMGEMITMIAHQWRQPLNTLTLQISNLQLRRMMGELVDIKEYDKTLEQISSTITYLSETIDDFQTFFHPDRELNEIEVEELLQKALNFIKPRLKGQNIEIELLLEENYTIKVYINELIQVLLNILNNAIDALIECDRKEKKIKISVEVEDDVKIYIQDSACGIPEEIVERLFEPYFSTKGKNGTGLGLYMSQMIMQKQFGGDIQVKSSPNGSTFIIEFPKF